MADGYDALTEKEKEMLRLMARGHDAKSAASALSLSVHTINERLRAARRKLAVTSSREAARLVLDREGEHHENLADKDLGEDPYAGSGDQPGSRRKGAWLIGGIFMSVLTAAALLRLTPLASDGAGSPDAETAARDRAGARAGLAHLGLGNLRATVAGHVAHPHAAARVELVGVAAGAVEWLRINSRRGTARRQHVADHERQPDRTGGGLSSITPVVAEVAVAR